MRVCMHVCVYCIHTCSCPVNGEPGPEIVLMARKASSSRGCPCERDLFRGAHFYRGCFEHGSSCPWGPNPSCNPVRSIENESLVQ